MVSEARPDLPFGFLEAVAELLQERAGGPGGLDQRVDLAVEPELLPGGGVEVLPQGVARARVRGDHRHQIRNLVRPRDEQRGPWRRLELTQVARLARLPGQVGQTG